MIFFSVRYPYLKFIGLILRKMTINVNNQLQSVLENSSVSTLLGQLNIAANGIAVAINDHVIPKNDWDTILLNPTDEITIIQATQGG